jgi:hypothetical protein
MADSSSVLGIFAAAKELLFGDLQSHESQSKDIAREPDERFVGAERETKESPIAGFKTDNEFMSISRPPGRARLGNSWSHGRS